ncbi:G2/M phase-specific E3 ubiquitin-protein ligase-like [Osmerus eperlanus]|uniref:G2/M phase-specific E3 ubiquitin-protein ligase-like n=1 Tax=Osmerus eperlanus TaxID=29151 RepID=UPI002E0EFEB2
MSEDSDEEFNQAIQASLEDQIGAGCTENVPVTKLLNDLAAQINVNATSKFNINRSAVLDGTIRGFKRSSYNPRHRISVTFSDDSGNTEEAIDLGGPRREFLRLLMQALKQSSMFEGAEESQNLALDSQALREDRYFIAGRAIAISLVHGGPAPGFLSSTLFSCLSGSPETAKPTLDDVADIELRGKIKRILESATMTELNSAIEPLLDYLTNCGCLRAMKTVNDKEMLLEDILMFQVINRVRGPFERFCEGMKTLGVLEQLQQHPDAFCPLLCHKTRQLTADILDNLFQIQFSESGSNRRMAENNVTAYWRDYLQDAEDEEGPTKLGKILTFATGASEIPPIGFSPQPSIEFLHDEQTVFNSSHGVSAARFPMANTCVNCLRIPLHSAYEAFKTNMDFAIANTQGFGMQ